jgi:hypothetical protein
MDMTSDAVARIRHLRQYGFVIQEVFGATAGYAWYAILSRSPQAEVTEVATVWILLDLDDVPTVQGLMVDVPDV